MKISRLRLRLAGGFALAFGAGLAILAAFGLSYLSRTSSARFDRRLARLAHEVWIGVLREHHEWPDSSLAFITRQVAVEWSATNESFLILRGAGTVLSSKDVLGNAPTVISSIGGPVTNGIVKIIRPEAHLRAWVLDTVLTGLSESPAGAQPLRVVSFDDTRDMEADSETLAFLFAVSLPLVLVLSLLAGYFLAGRALRPVRSLADAMAAIAPDDLDTRLHVDGGPADEVSLVATEFNALLARLQEARARNIQFVREAAHQIRTPLTLVLGEASHALGEGRHETAMDPAQSSATLARIQAAAQAMRRRVDELFLLAESRTGERVRLEEQVELDSLVLECTDLMRARARETGHRLAIGTADAISVHGNSSLLQEAIVELIENACRYADRSHAITVSCMRTDTDAQPGAVLEVSSAGAALALPAPRSDDSLHGGMGLSIVRWVASSHHGALRVERRASMNHVQLVLPIL